MDIVLDIDGTIIGNIAVQRTLYLICSKIGIPYKFTRLPIRPYFKQFIDKHVHCRFFAYTANLPEVAELVVQYIEKQTNMKFERPIFSRESTIWTGNEFQKATKLLHNVSKSKYVIIDNMNNYNTRDLPHLIACPSYNKITKVNVKTYISEKTYISNKNIINDIVQHNLFIGKKCKDYDEFIQIMTKFQNSILQAPTQDVFWKTITIKHR